MTAEPKNEPLRKFCVFCGKKPESKTREHIIPQWLIKLTGDINREINLGINTQLLRKNNEFKPRKFAFSSFQFPACDSCNNEYSELEVKTKNIVEKILEKNYISNTEINTLLDWFDKVRVGLWLGSLLLDRDIAPVDPTFFIKNRIGEKDRCLIIYEVDDDWKGIQFIGFNSPAFQFSPSCFALCINNYYFFNISTDFLFSQNIGFPFPSKQTFEKDDNRTFSVMNCGTRKVKTPLIQNILIKPSLEIYQPMIFSNLGEIQDDEGEKLYDNEYVRNNCLDYSKGIGKVFYMDEKKLIEVDDDLEICFSDVIKYDREKFLDLIAKQVFDTQLNQILTKIPSTENLDDEESQYIKSHVKSITKMQKEFAGLLKKGIR